MALRQAPLGHWYPLLIIQLAISQVMQSLTSFRGVQQTFELLAQYLPWPTPSMSSIRRWVLRLGLYELQRQRAYRTDWIYILDLTIELGAAKCLVILGLPQARWQRIVDQEQRGVQHHDVEVLDLQILESSRGEVIEDILNDLTQQVGAPVQILSDHGSDLKKGVELYLTRHPDGIYTYDLSHWLALQFKAELATDERYQAFIKHAHHCRAQLQQTHLSELMPPAQRTQARYFNVDRLVHWGQRMLQYQQQGDFSRLSNEYILDELTLERLAPELPPPIYHQLAQVQGRTYPQRSAFTEFLRQLLEPPVFQTYAQLITQAASVGRRRFEQSLGWLQDYQADLDTYSQMLELSQQLQQQLNHKGLNAHSITNFIETTPTVDLSPRLQDFYGRLITYLVTEGKKVPPGQSLLTTSDIIESIFGKYKLFSARSCLKEIGPMILTIPLCTLEITTDLVKHALETIRTIDVEQWLRQTLGPSILSQRKALFNSSEKDTKVA